MISINLLPEELRKIERARKVTLNIAFLTGIGIIVAVVVLIIIFAVIGIRVRQVKVIRARLARLAPVKEESQRLINLKQQTVKQLDLLEGFHDRRISWSRRLNEVSDAIPEELFLVKLSYSTRPPGNLVIKGEARAFHANEKVVEFIDSLRRNRSFIIIFPQINYSIETMERGRKSFEITCGPEKKEEKEKK